MPRSAKDKLKQGIRRVVPYHKFIDSAIVTVTPPANSFTHLFQVGVSPALGAYPGVALAKTQLVGGSSPSITGGIVTVADPVSPAKNYLTSQSLRNLVSTGTGTLWLLDLLVCYQGINANSNALQTMTGSGAGSDQRPRTSGARSVMFADVQTSLGATPANLTVTYTDIDGLTSGRTTAAEAMVISSAVGRMPNAAGFIPLASGDNGVASIQSAQLSAAMGAGTFALVIADILAQIPIVTTLIEAEKNYAANDDALIEIPTGAALSFVWEPTAATASQRLRGLLTFSEADLDAA